MAAQPGDGAAGVNFLNAVLGGGLRLDRVDEPGADDYPLLLAFRATR